MENYFIKSGKGYNRLKISEVDYIFTEGNYSTFFTSSGKHVAKISMKQLGELIPSRVFVRVHRNYIVKFDNIQKIDPQKNVIHLEKTTIPIGKSFKKQLLKDMILLG